MNLRQTNLREYIQDKILRAKEIYAGVHFPAFMSENEFKALHTDHLIPLRIKIDTNQFLNEIALYKDKFFMWGEKYPTMPRYGAALVNNDGTFKEKDPANYPNDEWNERYPDTFLTDADMVEKTPLYDAPSLSPLKVFDEYFYRSNILYWEKGACISPHFDTLFPSPFLRLWGCTNPENIDVNFLNSNTNKMEKWNSIEAGRIYLIDTSVVHEGICTNDTVYQFFICLSPNAKDVIKENFLVE